MEVKWVEKPKTKPPGPGAYACFEDADGNEHWVEIPTEQADGLTAKDFDFGPAKKWAQDQQKQLDDESE